MSALAGISLLGFGLLAIGFWMMKREKSLRIVTWMYWLAGFCVTGGLAATVYGILNQVGGSGAKLFSVSLTGVMTIAGIILMLEFWHAAHPRKGEPKPHHPLLAFITPLVLGLGALHVVVVTISNALGHLPITTLLGG
jgi:hypothetical protein